MRRFRMRWLAPVVLLTILTGCVTIPTSGGVTTQQVDVADPDQLLTLAAPPTPDSSPEEIIADFLRAGRGPQEDYKVAREYLTDDFRDTWSPYARTLISSTPIVPVALADNTWNVPISAAASVDDLGQYKVSSPAESFDLTFGLVKNDDGQWRISSGPDGTVLPSDRFSSIFARYELYFFDPSFQYLVPDLRWFRSGGTAAASAVDALLAGPSERLGAGSLKSAFSSGTRRDVDGPTQVVGGIATVSLSNDVAAGGTTAHRRMQQQLLQTLRSVGTVRQVDILVGGGLLQIPDGGQTADSSYVVGNDPIGGVDGRVGVLDPDGGVSAISGIGRSADAVEATGGAIVSGDRSSIVLLGPAGVTVVRAGQDPAVVDDRAGLVAPSLDPLGFTWSVPAGNPSGLLAIGPDGTQNAVAGLPSGDQVISIDVSRDGARLLVAVQTPDGPRLVVAGISRDSDLVPTELITPLQLPVGASPIIDAAWVDGVTVVVLTEGTLDSVDAYEIGGQHTSLGTLDNGVAIVGGNGVEGTRVLDTEGNVLRPGGGTLWQDTGIDASFLVSQQ
jgi:hypothetical protein